MKKMIEAIINETIEFGSCYVGSYEEDCCIRTEKTVEKIDRYAREHFLTTEYKMVGTDCYLVKVRKLF